METRQQQLLNLVIENHIATAEPVGSKFLVSEGNLDWSEATVRNELRILEEEGYLTHPHTSAGRIPTTKGYRYFIDHLNFSDAKINKSDEEKIKKDISKSKNDLEKKQLAKNLADVSMETVVLAFSENVFYYTGLSNLFQKPEFNELNLVVNISSLFDRFEDLLGNFYSQVNDDPTYFIGEEHNLGDMLSVLAVRFGEEQESLLALLGPKRMNYEKNYMYFKKVLEIIE